MKSLILGLLAVVTLLPAAPRAQKFTGKITDSMCSRNDHSHMKMGDTDAECTIACVRSHGALFVLFDGKHTYMLSDQTTPEKFAGKKVTVTGTLDAKSSTIKVSSMVGAK
jgi:hypothetical protein